MAAALLNDEQTGDLVLHPRRHHNRAWLCQRLHSGSSVRRIAVNLPGRIDNYRPGLQTNAGGQMRRASADILGIEFGQRALD